jgi:UDP-N-acetylmuramyl pentapeptide synthase
MVGIGSLAKWYIEGIQEDCHSQTVAKLFDTISDAKPYIQALMQKGDVLLFKGSRVMKLDVLVDELLNEG